MSQKTKRYLMLLMAIGLVAVAAGGGSGTFASFTAETANNGNYFQTGTLFLHDSTNGTTCTSESASDNKNLGAGDNCSFIFHLQDATTTQYFNIALKNAGTIPATGINFYTNSACSSDPIPLSDGTVNGAQTNGAATSITVTGLQYGIPDNTTITIDGNPYTTDGATNPGATVINIASASISFAGGEAISFAPNFDGGGDLCQQLQFAMWEVPNAGTVVPGANPCAYFSGCGFTGNTLDLLPLTTGAANSPLTLSAGGGSGNGVASTGLDAGGTRYVLIGVKPPTNLGNAYQNHKATVSIAWHIGQ